MSASENQVGRSVYRREDPSLVTGEARYTDDLTAAHMLYMSLVRSPHACAAIQSIDTDAARKLPGVKAVFTSEDVRDSGIEGIIPPGKTLPDQASPAHPLLATDRVRYQGEPVAVVLADDRSAARDGVERVRVSYRTEESVLDPRRAIDEDAPPVHADVPGNRVFDWETGDADRVQEAFEEADRVVELKVRQQRILPNAMEPRATLAQYERAGGRLTLQTAVQAPHHVRALVSMALEIPEHRIRVIAPDVGGGFGSKDNHYSEEVLTGWCAVQMSRPVKWTATRSESYLSDVHGRAHVIQGELAVDKDGTLRGLRVESLADLGAYVGKYAPTITTESFASVLSGQYRVPAIHARVQGVLTNAVPADAYRGAGMPEGCFLLERLLDRAARELEIDPVDLRRRNMIRPEQMPYTTAHGQQYDSGDYPRALEKALKRVDYETLREEQKAARERDRYLGVGVCCWIKSASAGPARFTAGGTLPSFYETGTVRFHPSGTVTAYSGASGHGQGHGTSFAQVLSDRLGVSYDDIEVIESDTDEIPQGNGTFASRSMAIGGSALAVGAERIVEKGRRIAAHHLEAAPEDLEFEDGVFQVQGVPSRRMTIQEVARAAYQGDNLPEGMELGLEATAFYNPENFTFPFGTHVAVVEVHPGTGDVSIRRYVTVDDCGIRINPMLVEGQIHGAVAQGIGQALYEEARYDSEGNLTSGSMMDYAVPKAGHIPEMETDFTETPCPHNPLGVKGIGEAGSVAAPPAVVNAVIDALEPFGVEQIDMPLTSEKVWRAIHGT